VAQSRKSKFSQVDGLLIREVGPWSKDKHFALMRYIDAVTTAMRDKFELHYVDPFAGPGRCAIRETEEEIEGSPLIAAGLRFPFDRLHLCDLDPKAVEALTKRLENKALPLEPQILCGDANDLVHEVLKEIPDRRTLTIGFLDPTGLHLHYETVRRLGSIRSDLIIYFPDFVDANRNAETVYASQSQSSLDLVLGEGNQWREHVLAQPFEKRPECLRRLYVSQLRKLGWKYFDYQRVGTEKNQPLYVLVYCSKSQFASKLWNRTHLVDTKRQRLFDFGE
jgi:three-Cys-motif partner protein